MKFSSRRWKLHFVWTSFLMQSPINIMSFAVFSENGYRCDFWIDRKIEHLNVLGKTDGIFVLGKTLSEWKQLNWWQDSWGQPNYVQFLCLFLFNCFSIKSFRIARKECLSFLLTWYFLLCTGNRCFQSCFFSKCWSYFGYIYAFRNAFPILEKSWNNVVVFLRVNALIYSIELCLQL